MSPVIVTRHKCRARHRSGRSFAKCAYPRAVVVGDGWVAVAVRCHLLRLELHETRAEAIERLGFLADAGCSAWCRGRHELMVFQPAATTPRSLPAVPRLPLTCRECGELLDRPGATARCRPIHGGGGVS